MEARVGGPTQAKTMRVTVKLFATLRGFHPGSDPSAPLQVSLEPGASLAQLLRHLGIPDGMVKVAFVNGVIVRDEAAPLHDGDEVGLFPPIAGGR